MKAESSSRWIRGLIWVFWLGVLTGKRIEAAQFYDDFEDGRLPKSLWENTNVWPVTELGGLLRTNLPGGPAYSLSGARFLPVFSGDFDVQADLYWEYWAGDRYARSRFDIRSLDGSEALGIYNLRIPQESTLRVNYNGTQQIFAPVLSGSLRVMRSGSSMTIMAAYGAASWATLTTIDGITQQHFRVSMIADNSNSPGNPPSEFPAISVIWDDFQASGRIANPTGDYDIDGDVDGGDFLAWQLSFGSTTDVLADGNLNGIVDSSDLTIWQLAYPMNDALGQKATPEPNNAVSILVVALIASAWRRT